MAKRPRVEETTRPWRLYDAKQKANLRWRYFKTSRRAEESALVEVAWATVGTTIEVYNCTNGRVGKSYTLKPDGFLQITR